MMDKPVSLRNPCVAFKSAVSPFFTDGFKYDSHVYRQALS
jgi:hypothetical protein